MLFFNAFLIDLQVWITSSHDDLADQTIDPSISTCCNTKGVFLTYMHIGRDIMTASIYDNSNEGNNFEIKQFNNI